MIDGIEVARHPRARRVRLTVCRVSGTARLVVPQRASLSKALAWAETKRGWIETQRAALPRPCPLTGGATITVADEALTIAWQAGNGRSVVRRGLELSVGGPEETVGRRIEAWLRRTALDLLSRETAEYAAAAGVSISKVAVGDARGRWGSCAATGAIRYSWRLILAPGWVRRATVAHEVAHRVHMNHGAAFHALVARLYGSDPTPARDWLRRHGAALHWVGRSN